MKLRTLGVISCPLRRQRFPGKPLTMIAGKPLIQHVYEQVAKATQINKIVVATEDAHRKGCESVRRRGDDDFPSCATGTDGLAEVSRQLESEFVVNIRVDENR